MPLAKDETLADALAALQDLLTAVTTGTQNVDSSTLATELGQDTIVASLATLLTELGQKIEPGDLVTLATAAKQDTIITALTTIAGYVNGLEGLLTTIGGYVDALEANTAGLAKTDVATTLTEGRKTVTTPGTAVAIRATLACKWVTGNALFSNTQQVNIGGSGVLAAAGSSTGRGLQPGDSFSYPVADAAELFIDARVAGEGVSFTVGS